MLTKIIHYKLVKVTINIPDLVEVIFNIVFRYYSILDSVISISDLVFTSKFGLSLYYFFDIKCQLFINFYSQTDGLNKYYNSIIKKYFQTLVNFKPNNLANFLLITQLLYNNI